MKKIGNMTGMPRIDENRLLAIDDISITIVLIGIPPKVGIEVFLKFHKIDLPFKLSIND
jgi:hypothetical protein